MFEFLSGLKPRKSTPESRKDRRHETPEHNASSSTNSTTTASTRTRRKPDAISDKSEDVEPRSDSPELGLEFLEQAAPSEKALGKRRRLSDDEDDHEEDGDGSGSTSESERVEQVLKGKQSNGKQVRSKERSSETSEASSQATDAGSFRGRQASASASDGGWPGIDELAIDQEIVDALEKDNGTQLRRPKSVRLESTDKIFRVACGDAIEMWGDDPHDRWFGIVSEMRTLKNDATSQPEATASSIYIRHRWLYARQHFEGLAPSWQWSGKTQFLGDHELVETDHSDWTHNPALILGSGPRVVLKFNDRYPLNAIANDSPLSILAPKLSSSKVLVPDPPPYLFGDANHGDSAEWSGTRWVRSSIMFQETATESTKPSKKKKSKKSSPEKSGAKEMKLSPHSFSRQPYHLDDVQVWDRTTTKWYSTQELRARLHYEPTSSALQRPSIMRHAESATATKGRTGHSQQFALDAARSPSPSPSLDGMGAAELRGVLATLSNSLISRGGAYGLTGNVYMVMRAAEIADLIADSLATSENLEEGRDLVTAEQQWQLAVKRRGKAGLDLGSAPSGSVWVAPGQEKYGRQCQI